MSKKRTRLSRKESQELTRQRLLDAAVVVFAEKGFAQTRLDELKLVGAERDTRGVVDQLAEYAELSLLQYDLFRDLFLGIEF